MLTVLPLSPNFTVVDERNVPARDAELEATVRAIWREKKKRGDKELRNDKILCLNSYSPERIGARFEKYCYFAAQHSAPGLKNKLGICLVAVSGVLFCADGVVFGKRSPRTVHDPGQWELVPSGGVDKRSLEKSTSINVHRQIAKEAQEEIGLEKDEITFVRPLCCVRDDEQFVLDICLELRTALTGSAVRQRFAELDNREYAEITIVAKNTLQDFLNAHQVAEISKALLKKIS